MANTDRAKGFVPYGPVKQTIVAEAGSAVYPGDMVQLANDGQVDPVSAGNTIYGCALSYASGAGVSVLVSVDPDQIYIGQIDDQGTTLFDAQTDIGNVCDLVATGGNSTYKTSRQEIDSSDLNTTSGQLVILGLAPRSKNAFGDNAEVLVKINEHQTFGKDAFAGI